MLCVRGCHMPLQAHTTSPQRGNSSGAQPPSSRSRDACTEAPSLVASCKQNHIQTLIVMHLIHTGRAPQYLVDSVQSVITSSQRHLRSSETTDYVKRTTRTKLGERGFSYSGPAAWNSLPSHLRTMTDTNVFKRHLKAFLFTESFS